MFRPTFRFIALIITALVIIESIFVIGWIFGAEDRYSVFSIATIDQNHKSDVIFSTDQYTQSLYDWAYEHAHDINQVESKSAIVAHHLVVADEIAKVFETIGSNETDAVIILSPNHFAQGISPLQTTYGSWETYYGNVEVDQDLIDELTDDLDVLRIEDNTFENEHGVSSIVPFVAKSFPDAKLVPLVIDESLSSEDSVALVQAIQKHAPDAVVIASIDMSHYMPLYAQEFHDKITLRALELASAQDIDLEIDANAVLGVLMQLNEARATQDWQLSYHDSSIEKGLTDEYLENTSHILGYFMPGKPALDNFATLHVVGDIMLDREVRALIDEYGQDYPWLNMDRFLSGAHTTIGNLEGTVNELVSTYTANPPFRFVFSPESVAKMHEFIDVVSLANNHASDVGTAGVQETKDRLDGMGVAWFGSYATPAPRYDEDINGIALTYIGYHHFQPDINELEKQIAEANAQGRFVIVFPHWGSEYVVTPTVSQRELAQIMIDAGADLIIGGHPHVAQGIEMIGDVPVVYSLGNFIFDQVDPATYPALTAGVVIDEDSIEIHLMPVWTQGSQPTPMSDIEAHELLSNIAEASPESMMTEIKNGVITTIYNK